MNKKSTLIFKWIRFFIGCSVFLALYYFAPPVDMFCKICASFCLIVLGVIAIDANISTYCFMLTKKKEDKQCE